MKHDSPHPLAGTSVSVVFVGRHPQFGDEVQLRIEDYWDRVSGQSWMVSDGNPACLVYAARSEAPTDDDVLYGHAPDGRGMLVHISEVQAAV